MGRNEQWVVGVTILALQIEEILLRYSLIKIKSKVQFVPVDNRLQGKMFCQAEYNMLQLQGASNSLYYCETEVWF